MSDGWSNTVSVPSDAVEKDYDDVVVDDTAGGVVLLPANENRKSALIVNTGPAPMRITTDGSAPTPTHGKPVWVGGFLHLSSPYCPTKEIRAIRQGDTDTSANPSEVY